MIQENATTGDAGALHYVLAGLDLSEHDEFPRLHEVSRLETVEIHSACQSRPIETHVVIPDFLRLVD